MSDKKTPKVIFEPGCFDNFEGTQDELNELVAAIIRMAESGELEENARPIDLDNDEDLEILSHIAEAELAHAQRKLQ
jgi:hypothetical protein